VLWLQAPALGFDAQLGGVDVLLILEALPACFLNSQLNKERSADQDETVSNGILY
jgi:hypothetical protein